MLRLVIVTGRPCVVNITTLMEVEMKTEKIFTFRIPTTLLKAGHVLAESQDLTLAQLMRRLLHEAVLKAGQQP